MRPDVPLFVSTKDLKTLREALCRGQAAGNYAAREMNWVLPSTWAASSQRLQNLIDQIDIYRPLGSDGKHGDKHSDTCGCEDVE